MEKKTIIYIVGGIAVLGIGYYLYNKNKKKTASPTPVAETKSEGETIDVTLKPKMEKPEREGRPKGKPTNPNLKSQGLISFDGMNTYSNMTSDFDISFR